MKMNIRILSRKICFGLLLMIMPIMFESCLTTALVYTISQDLKSQNQDQKETTTPTNNSKKTTKEKSKGSDKNNESDIIRLQCLGEGHTRHEAINNALRSGLEQVYGTFISSDTRILNDEIVKDEIVSLSSGNVTDYKILTESNVGNIWIVTIEGGFSQQKLAKYVVSKGETVTVSTSVYAQNILIEKAQREAETKLELQKVEKAKLIAPLCVDYIIDVEGPGKSPKPNIDAYLITVNVYAEINDNFAEVAKLLEGIHRSNWGDYSERDRRETTDERSKLRGFASMYCGAADHFRLYRDGIDVTKGDPSYKVRISGQTHDTPRDRLSMNPPKSGFSFGSCTLITWRYVFRYEYYLTFEELQKFQSEFRVEYIN